MNFIELLNNSGSSYLTTKCGWNIDILKYNSEHINGLVYNNDPNCCNIPYYVVWNKYGISIDIEQKPWHNYLGLKRNDR